MPDVSFDPTSVIRAATDAPAPASAAAQNNAESASTFGDHLSRARRSNSPQSPADRADPSQTQPTNSQDPKPDDAASKSSRDDQQKQPQKAAADKQGDPANNAPPADTGANAAAVAAANPAPATLAPVPEKDALKAAETAKTTDAALKAAAGSQATASKAATSPAAATAEQAAVAQATAAAAAIPQPAPIPTKTPQPTAAQTAGADKATPINPQLAALIQATTAKTAATKTNAPTTSAAPPPPGTSPPTPAAAETKSSLATKAILAAQTSALSPNVQPGANHPSQNSQDGSNAAAGAAAAAAVTQIIADAPTAKTVESGVDKILSGPTKQAASQLAQAPAASAPPVSASQSTSVAPGQLPGNANNFAAGVQAKAGADGPSAATTDADRLRFVQRVARAFQAAGDNGGQVKLRLSPPELGSLQLNITMKDGTMTAHIQAETSSAQNLLLNNLPDLRERLAQQDIRIERFDVDLMDRSPGGMPQTPDQNQNANDFGRRAAPSRSSPADATTEAILPVRAASYQGSGGLNVLI